MAEKSLFESYLNCHVCSETFRDPVSLSCHHNFCSSCLQTFWERDKNNNCPVCERKSSKGLIINFPLKELAESFAGRQKAASSETGKGEEEEEEEEEEVVCSKHPKETKFFREDEPRAVSPVWQFPCYHWQPPGYGWYVVHESPHHQRRARSKRPDYYWEEFHESRHLPRPRRHASAHHQLRPVCEPPDHTEDRTEQAVSDLKDQLKSVLEPLQDKRNKHKKVEETYNKVVQHSKNQLVATERQIRAEFNKLHQFLEEEEKARLKALREEDEQKGKTISREMKILQEKISSLSDSISAVEEDLQKDDVSFLTSYKATQTSARAQCSLSDPQLVSGVLIDVAKHLGNLSFRVWEKMKGKVQFSPVILDPNTASPWLCLSDDLTSVRYGDTEQQLPDNPERNMNYTTVLGSEGFSSGKHSWEVEVGHHHFWAVGLAKESVNRKGQRCNSPNYGIWCLWHHGGIYTYGLCEKIRVKKSLQRIRVQLDYDRGELSLYNAEDKTHICTYRDTFTEKLYPFISAYKTHHGIKIRQDETCQ
ncbi:nuclear factor 7, ovary-like [Diretmus argenteus]